MAGTVTELWPSLSTVPDRSVGRLDNLAESYPQLFLVRSTRKFVVGISWLSHHFQISIVIPIELHDPFDHSIVAVTIIKADKTGRIEITMYERIAPIDRQ
jgi:hypothetical protein